MSVAASKSQPKAAKRETESLWARFRLSEPKGQELLAVTMVTVGLLAALSLLSYHPADPSLLHTSSVPSEGTRNWIGPFGAQMSSLLLGVFGVSAAVVPLLLLLSGWRRFRSAASERVVGRGGGVLILMVATPGLTQLLFEEVAWRGGSLAAGGGLGVLIQKALETQLGFVGTLLLLVAAVLIGGTLVVQTTLGDLLALLSEKARGLWQRSALALARRRERSEKEARTRQKAENLRRVMEKHQRKPAPASDSPGFGSAPGGAEKPPAPRVRERKGELGSPLLRIRKGEARSPAVSESVLDALPASSSSPPAAARPTGKSRRQASPKAPAIPQGELSFSEDVEPGKLPPVNLMQLTAGGKKVDENDLVRLGELIRSRCAEFGVEGSVVSISPGPVITVYEYQPAPGVKVSRIVNLQDDLALALKADSIRIDRLPGRSTLGIEVPNDARSMIRLGSLLADDAFVNAPSPLTLALGVTIGGEAYYADLATMPHLLVAGATGAGKSVGLQSMITSILFKATREDVQFIFIDPKRVELGVYKSIPHLKAEVVVDPKKAANALRWAVSEMERRYRLLAEVHVRSISFYNQAIRDPEVRKRLSLGDDESEVSMDDLKPLPYYVIIIDELADLMMVASSEVETCIARLAQMARAVGIHLIIATQRPSVDVLTGTIKANFPCRIAYATTTRHDSRTILDQVGSEQLLGKGDMLFMAPGTSRLVRLHGAYISEQETAGLVRWLKKQGPPELDPTVLEEAEKSSSGGSDVDDGGDELYDEAARLVVAEGQASASFLQRRMRVGFSRAARLVDMMERDGLLGPPQGSKPREVLVKPDFFEELDRAKADQS